MSIPPALRVGNDPVYERKVRIAKAIVLTLAGIVGLTLVFAIVLGVYHHVTDRPAKALFGISRLEAGAFDKPRLG